ncbi:MAG: SagB/ThcOx family dehydrogenase [Kaiparowitsia implicata GSE-PSE-MK54-09C]|jgi:SagB-type dehydrogenase family enzyme|nr:SagB/ThcOx family dehydrogenase [Kaiparowitsia implicata GSE-PSE-MK54-09C]
MTKDSGSISQHFHERTKYSPESLSRKAAAIDWSKQPIPFKDYKIGTRYDLKPYLSSDPNPVDLDWQWRRLSRLLFCSYGLTLKAVLMNGDPVYLRAAPSAGGLYPAEIYLVSRGTPLLPAGLYHYEPQSHSLLHFWEDHVWMGLQEACLWHPTLEHTHMALVTTAVFFRSAWRYQDRAYRRICLDTGHLLGNLELASAISDIRPHLIGGFVDTAINRLLYLDAEQEGAIAVLALADVLEVSQNLPPSPTTLPSPPPQPYPSLVDGELLSYLHQATQITLEQNLVYKPIRKEATLPDPKQEPMIPDDKYNFPFCLKVPTQSLPMDWGDRLNGLEKTMLKRRSTRAYSGGSILLEHLWQMLNFTYQPQAYSEQGLDRQPDYCDLNLIETFVAISGVDGLEEGCYYYAPKAQELRQIRFKNFRQELHRLCLGQDLGRDAAAVVFHTADLAAAVAQHGDRAYRYLHLDAGHLAQRLNLAAIHLDLGVSGIGGFFDAQVNEVLGIPADEAVLYITTLGQPRGDR